MPRIHWALLLLSLGCCDGSISGPDGGASASSPSDGSHPGSPEGGQPPDAAPPAQRHARCGWIGPGDSVGIQAFVTNATYFDVVHPSWYAIAADGIAVRAIAGADDAQVLAAASANNVRVWPLVAGVDNPAFVRTMMGSATTRAAHIQMLVSLAMQHGYAGLDIDYEGLWTSSDRSPYTTFIQELARAMHAAGKQVSIAGPALTSNAAGNAWEYPVIAASLDVIHLMGYDYHWLGGDHVGPVAPLGWVDAAAAFAASTGNGAKFVLGVPNYGIAAGFACSGTECEAACGGSYGTVDTHMPSCPYGVYDAGRAPHCAYGGSTLSFDDLASLEEKVQAAHNHGLGGVTYWTIGREHAGWFQMVRRYF